MSKTAEYYQDQQQQQQDEELHQQWITFEIGVEKVDPQYHEWLDLLDSQRELK